MRKRMIVALVLAALTLPARAEDDIFSDEADNAKRHAASGFVCPQKIGRFERDAAGTRDPEEYRDYCAYSARDGVYGTIVLSPVSGAFDPKALLAPDFVVQEGTGGKMTGEGVLQLGPDGSLAVYTRIYDITKIEETRYRVLFACAAVGNWAVEVTVEYGDPRNKDLKDEFLNAVYASALATFAVPPSPPPAP